MCYESKGYTLTKWKFRKEVQSQKKLNEVIPTIKKKTHQFHVIKSNKEVTLKTRETCFLYRKTRKLKILKIVFKKLFSKNLLKTFSFVGKSHSAEKNEKWPALWNDKLGVSFKMGYDESKFSFLRTYWHFYSALAYSWASNLCSCRTVRGGKYPAAQRASCSQLSLSHP